MNADHLFGRQSGYNFLLDIHGRLDNFVHRVLEARAVEARVRVGRHRSGQEYGERAARVRGSRFEAAHATQESFNWSNLIHQFNYHRHFFQSMINLFLKQKRNLNLTFQPK